MTVCLGRSWVDQLGSRIQKLPGYVNINWRSIVSSTLRCICDARCSWRSSRQRALMDELSITFKSDCHVRSISLEGKHFSKVEITTLVVKASAPAMFILLASPFLWSGQSSSKFQLRSREKYELTDASASGTDPAFSHQQNTNMLENTVRLLSVTK